MLLLGLPSAALAQSAGDNQYQDPFEDQGGGGQTQQQGSTQTQQQAQTPSTTQSQSTAPSTTTAQAAPAQTNTLPRTGSETTPLLLAYGAVLLLGGVALRRAARHPA